jgi:rRNA biogenesis protein RRP5
MVTDEDRGADSVPIKQRKQYRKGTAHQARVCQFNRIDGLAILSLQKSVLEKPYMKYSDIEAGDVVGGVIERVCSFGMIISVTDNLRGLCPRIHTSDTKTIISRAGIKYKEGSKVKCRVVNVEPNSKRLMLTCKKSLLRGKVPIEYSSIQPGDRCSGVISSVHSYGCIVHFFNLVKGLVRKVDTGSAAARTMSDLSQVFWAGQPVECRVLECDASTQRLILSFVLDPAEETAIDEADALTPGSIVDGELTAIASNGISLKYPVTGESLFLPTLHLSDYPRHCSFLLSSHQRQLEGALKESE